MKLPRRLTGPADAGCAGCAGWDGWLIGVGNVMDSGRLVSFFVVNKVKIEGAEAGADEEKEEEGGGGVKQLSLLFRRVVE